MAVWNNNARQPGGKGKRSPQEEKTVMRRAVIFIMLALLASWLMSGIFVLDEKQQAVIMRLGKFHKMARHGLNWTLPYPIESHALVSFAPSGSVLIGDIAPPPGSGMPNAAMLTADGNIVELQLLARYRMRNLQQYLQSQASDGEWLLKQIGAGILREEVGSMTLREVLQTPSGRIAQHVLPHLQAELDAQRTDIEITDLAATTDSVQVNKALSGMLAQIHQTQQKRENTQADAKAYAEQTFSAAKKQIAAMREEADAYKAATIASAQADAERFAALLPTYQQAPQATQNRLYLNTMQQVLGKATKVVVDSTANQQPVYLWPNRPVTQKSKSADVATATVPANAASDAQPSAASAAVTEPASAAASAASKTKHIDLRSRDPAQWRSRH